MSQEIPISLLCGSTKLSVRGDNNDDSLNVRVNIFVTLKDLYTGCDKREKVSRNRKCNKCSGSGYIRPELDCTCTTCSGTGKVTKTYRFGPFTRTTNICCEQCNGEGSTVPDNIICYVCDSTGMCVTTDIFNIIITPGMVDGQSIQIDGDGDENKDGIIGDLIFVIHEELHDSYRRVDNNLVYRKSISMCEALCGINFILKFINDKPLFIKCGAVINPIHTYKLAGWGMLPIGDLIIEFDIIYPERGEFKRELKKVIKNYFKRNDTTGYKIATLIKTFKKETTRPPENGQTSQQ